MGQHLSEPIAGELAWAGQSEKVCHDLKQNIATGLLLSDPEASVHIDAGLRRRLEMMHQLWQDAAEMVAVINDEVDDRGQRVDLGEVARACVAPIRATHEIVLDIDAGEHVVTSDRLMLRRAIANLLDNACRATPPAGRVVVRVGSEAPEIFVEVLDEGPGFGRITSGSGLGLEIARGAVWAASGQLQIKTGPRSGTSVRMSFPAELRVLP